MSAVFSRVIGSPKADAVDALETTSAFVSDLSPVTVAVFETLPPVPGAAKGPMMQLVDSPGAKVDVKEHSESCDGVRRLSVMVGLVIVTSPELVTVNRYQRSKPDASAVATFSQDDELVGSGSAGS